jgi:hypothetical protein
LARWISRDLVWHVTCLRQAIDVAYHIVSRALGVADGHDAGGRLPLSNIAEGFSRHSTAFYVQHLWMAHASGGELETQVEIARRIQIVGAAEAANLISSAQEVARMLNGLVSSLERRR